MLNSNVQLVTGDSLPIVLSAGEVLFLLGSNGAGKSALIQEMLRQSTGQQLETRRLSAHRQIFLESQNGEGGMIRPHQVDYGRKQSDSMSSRENQFIATLIHDARWQELEPEIRLSNTLFDLVASENARARAMAQSFEVGDVEQAQTLMKDWPSPLAMINEVLGLSGIKISLTLDKDGKLLVGNQVGHQYSLAQASDGERSAVIAAATVITAPVGSLLLIDEPDKHLHRSVIVPFMLGLFDIRKDCSYIVSTYQTDLPGNCHGSRALIVRSCQWEGDEPKAWDIDEIRSEDPLPEWVKTAVLNQSQGEMRRYMG